MPCSGRQELNLLSLQRVQMRRKTKAKDSKERSGLYRVPPALPAARHRAHRGEDFPSRHLPTDSRLRLNLTAQHGVSLIPMGKPRPGYTTEQSHG